MLPLYIEGSNHRMSTPDEIANEIEKGPGFFEDDSVMVLQSGTGLLSTGMKLAKMAKGIASGIDQVTFGPIGTAISNTASEYMNKNPEWKPGFAGERHVVLPTLHGPTRANFAGPGTRLDKRLPRRDSGVDGPFGIDAAAKIHDVDYANARTYGQIRKADDKFVKRVRASSSTPVMKNLTVGAIKAKNFGEDVGLISKKIWTGKGKGKDYKFNVVRDERDEKMKPAQLLKKMQAKKVKKKKKRLPRKHHGSGRGRRTDCCC